MTPTVNLVPIRYADRLVERRQAGWVAAGLLALLALVALVSLAQGREVRRAERRRDVERAHNSRLEERRRELRPFGELAGAVVARERLVSAALRTEVAWSRVLVELALSLPPDASLTSLTLELGLPAFGTIPLEAPTKESAVIGTTTFKGYSVRQFAPGVERTLHLLAAARGVSEPRLQEGAVEDIDDTPVTTFEGGTFLDAAALTGRYANGLPPEHDVDIPPLGGSGVPAGASP